MFADGRQRVVHGSCLERVGNAELEVPNRPVLRLLNTAPLEDVLQQVRALLSEPRGVDDGGE